MPLAHRRQQSLYGHVTKHLRKDSRETDVPLDSKPGKKTQVVSFISRLSSFLRHSSRVSTDRDTHVIKSNQMTFATLCCGLHLLYWAHVTKTI